jgi:peptidoglycan/LPS O-acetylase OafA/YrhL
MTNLDELMAVWRSQEAAPLHGVNETLLRLALRQEQAKLQSQRRRDAWITYIVSAGLIAIMAIFAMMMVFNDDDVIVSWDYAIPIAGGASAMLMGVALFVSRRRQMRHEERFGDSLRDQLGRRIAQIDYEATTGSRLANVLLAAIFAGSTAILLAGMRVNSEPDAPFDEWPAVVGMIVVSAICSLGGVWAQRQSVNRDLLPRKHRLEALLKELDAS